MPRPLMPSSLADLRRGAPAMTSSSKAKDDKPADAPRPACAQCRSRKVRCDREMPACSNCRKGQLSCDFNNKSKRINHTKQLVEDFSTLEDRLDSINASIAKVAGHMEQLAPLQGPSSVSSFDTQPAAEDDLTLFRRASSRASPTSPHSGSSARNVAQRPVGRYLHSVDAYGGETYYGATSATSLFNQSRMLVQQALRPEKQQSDGFEPDSKKLPADLFVTEQDRRALEAVEIGYPYPEVCAGTSVSGCGKPVSRPPRPFLEPAVDSYFAENSLVLPLFDETNLRNAIEENYSSHSINPCAAWSLCFNNIIVLVMGAKLRAAKLMGIQGPDLDEDIFIPFLANSRRAFDHLHEYTEARLVNVQALATLALVASEYFGYGVFERLVQRACSLAQEMGLHHRFRNKSEAMIANEDERRTMFWSLYMLDKMRTSITGHACELYVFQSDLDLPASDSDNFHSRYFAAKVHMMSLWEEIWLGLYSSRASRNSPSQKKNHMARLGNHLRNWASQNKSLLESPPGGEDLNQESFLRLDLRYIFHVGQVLVHRCGQDSTSEQIKLKNSRACMGIISEIHRAPCSLLSITFRSRMFRGYSIAPFHAIHMHHLLNANDPEYAADMALLETCSSSIQLLNHPTMDVLYYNKIFYGMCWCLSVNRVVHNAAIRSRMSRTSSVSSNMGSSALNQGKRPSPGSGFDYGATATSGPDDGRVSRVVRRKTTPEHASDTSSSDTFQMTTRQPIHGASQLLPDFEHARMFNFSSETTDNVSSLQQLSEMMDEAVAAQLQMPGNVMSLSSDDVQMAYAQSFAAAGEAQGQQQQQQHNDALPFQGPNQPVSAGAMAPSLQPSLESSRPQSMSTSPTARTATASSSEFLLAGPPSTLPLNSPSAYLLPQSNETPSKSGYDASMGLGFSTSILDEAFSMSAAAATSAAAGGGMGVFGMGGGDMQEHPTTEMMNWSYATEA